MDSRIFISGCVVLMLSCGLAQASFFDDFEDGNADGWTFLERGVPGEGGDPVWSVVDESGVGGSYVLSQTTTNYDFTRDSSGGTTLGTIALAPGTYSDLVVDVDLRHDEASIYADAAVVFGYQDADNFYLFHMVAGNTDDPGDGWDERKVFEVRNGEKSEIAQNDLPQSTQEFHHVKVTHNLAVGQVIVALDGSEIINVTDARLETWTTGDVGPCSNNDAFSVDNFSAVPEPATMILLSLGGLVALKRRRN